jgi:hypothetical protein
MNERDEIYLRRIENTWQSRQDLAGVITLMLGLMTFGAFLLFVWVPGGRSASVMAGLMVLLLLACTQLLRSAAKVVEVRKVLRPARAESRVIDAEVVGSGKWRG